MRTRTPIATRRLIRLISTVTTTASVTFSEAAAAISTVTINSVNINDSSTANSVVRVKLAIDNAAITLAQISNLTIIGGADGSGFVFVEGLESDVNAALAGMTVTAGAGYSDADQLMVTTYASGIEGQFTFDAATAVNDAGSDSHDGTLEDGAIFFSDIEQGEVVELDGNDDAIFINSRFNDPTSTTVSGWVNLNSANGELINIGGVIALRVDETENGIAGYYWDGTQYITTTSGEFIAGTGWRHVAYTIDAAADTQTLYLDGVAVGSSTFASDPTYNLPAAFTHSTIGRHADPANNAFDLDGRVDDVRVYSRALSATEITQLASDQPDNVTKVDLFDANADGLMDFFDGNQGATPQTQSLASSNVYSINNAVEFGSGFVASDPLRDSAANYQLNDSPTAGGHQVHFNPIADASAYSEFLDLGVTFEEGTYSFSVDVHNYDDLAFPAGTFARITSGVTATTPGAAVAATTSMTPMPLMFRTKGLIRRVRMRLTTATEFLRTTKRGF